MTHDSALLSMVTPCGHRDRRGERSEKAELEDNLICGPHVRRVRFRETVVFIEHEGTNIDLFAMRTLVAARCLCVDAALECFLDV